MKKTALAAFIAACFTALPMGAQCGVVPVKPVTPVGCKDLRAQCQCDTNGTNCRWVWVCVK